MTEDVKEADLAMSRERGKIALRAQMPQQKRLARVSIGNRLELVEAEHQKPVIPHDFVLGVSRHADHDSDRQADLSVAVLGVPERLHDAFELGLRAPDVCGSSATYGRDIGQLVR